MPAPLLNTSTKDLRDAFTFNVTTAMRSPPRPFR